jgi:hypothetical protein
MSADGGNTGGQDEAVTSQETGAPPQTAEGSPANREHQGILQVNGVRDCSRDPSAWLPKVAELS